MKLFNHQTIGGLAVAAALFFIPSASRAADINSAASNKTPTPYPLKTCVVSGEKFGGDMGDPVVFVYTNKGVNQEIKFCCPMCKPKFLADPDKYMKTIKDAEDAQKKAAEKKQS
jgi:hypothetical protein